VHVVHVTQVLDARRDAPQHAHQLDDRELPVVLLQPITDVPDDFDGKLFQVTLQATLIHVIDLVNVKCPNGLFLF